MVHRKLSNRQKQYNYVKIKEIIYFLTVYNINISIIMYSQPKYVILPYGKLRER